MNSYLCSTSLVEQIKEKFTIQDALNRHFPGHPGKKKGSKTSILCVFHEERTPSGFVDHIRNRYSCFGCNTFVDQIGFYAKAEGIDNSEAIKRLAGELGLTNKRPEFDKRKWEHDQARRARIKARNESLELFVRQAWLDCIETEKFFCTLINHIYDELDLDRPGPIVALKNLGIIKFLRDQMLDGTDEEKLAAARFFRRWEICQKAAGYRL